MSRRIEDYALLGNGQTAALLSREGSIDWLCWPRYDDDACLAALLGEPENGCWSLAPAGAVITRERRYQDDTLIMETDVETSDGVARIVDFLPVDNVSNAVVRLVVGIRGTIRMRMSLRLRFNYGALAPWTTSADGVIEAWVGPDHVVLHADVPTFIEGDSVAADFIITETERIGFVLAYGPSDHRSSSINVEQALLTTQQYWRAWIDQFDNTRTAWPHVVRRSLLTLKALIHRDTGAMIAAPTTSLPEAPGGSLNWDYRYCWLRDTCFALVALLNAGFHDEACAWRDWLLRAIAGSPEHIRIMYRVDGGRHLHERTVDWLQGYRYAAPVRIGNAAAEQKQVDVLGEVIDCLDVARRGGLPSSQQEDLIETRIVEHLETVWNTAGSGIWESRSKPRHYTYSRVMAWVALDRFIRRRSSNDTTSARIKQLAELRATIRNEIYTEAWNEGLGTFTQFYGGDELDGSLLLMPLVGFLPTDDPRMAATIETIRRELEEDGLIRRRKKRDDGPNESIFLACSCWMADCLNMQGRTVEARAQFERVLALANDLTLLSEQYNAPRKELAGNFPQALTHLAVINTALGLCGPTLQRGGG
ncbi:MULTISPECIES: glycoside hydrolase family 15 protein [unclassified Caballeronia]|uniref:glycoside hydrolase family 15 protein n=1 Tax=unclassified Caballeronia TaxID=2646786 RepID=UPI00285B0CEA|nr:MULTISPECIES: glycoside hydrolase family 15 protein [unclassified Caballeronia]MDR5752886.1 glycoside hydrolase family 15 protein [Caballeronia sp. LZ024]MDR5845606.1 glycoside hydrolase family 15 protein [Caballeronia sp. LZ031]